MRNFYLTQDLEDFLKNCRIEFCKGSGHGGQKINKTSISVLLTHIPSGLSAQDASSRSQKENKIHAAEKLLYLIAEKKREIFSLPEGMDLADVPSVNNKKRHVFWAAIMLDAWAQGDFDPKKTAQITKISVSRLTRIAGNDIFVWQCINRARSQNGLHCLKGN